MKSFTTPIYLYNETAGVGISPPKKADEVHAMCNIDNVGSIISINALASSLKLTKQVEMWAYEYTDQLYCEINNIKYCIQSATKTGTDMTVRLLLSRG